MKQQVNPGSFISKAITMFLFAALVSACGGGSGGPSTGDVVTVGGGTTENTDANGIFVDNPVNGLDYVGNPSGRSGVTGDNGTTGGFTVDPGDTVTFSLGDLVLGTSNAIFENSIVTPAELAGDETNANNPLAIRIAQVIQSLDSDQNTSNGITIDPAVSTRLSDGTVDAAALQSAIESGTNFETVFGGVVDDLTAGNANRAEGDIVSAAQAKAELAEAVEQDTSGTLRDVLGGDPIIAAEIGNCPVGTLSNNRVTIFTQSFPVCVLNSDITSNVTLTNDHVYLIDGSVSVGDGDVQGGPSGANNAVLTVEPGTQIYGINGALSGLVITRGSRIEALGTAHLPIIMAAVNATGTGANTLITDDPTDLTGRGQWAGLVLSGSGINNLCGGSLGTPPLFSEATPTGVERYFGCNDNSDNSGTVEYVVIAESGLGFRPNQEVQGLTLEGVGSGTRINYLQVLGSEDDGIEWFGGAANASNIVINGQDDDGLDFDEGAQLTVQKALVIMGSANGDKGIEADSLGPSGDVTFDATPSSQVNFVNLTILGDVGAGGGTRGANFRLGFGGRLIRSGIVDGPGSAAFATGCLDFDDEVDAFTQLRDFVADCTGGTQTGGVANNTNAANFVTNGDNETGNGDAPANERDVTAYTGTLNATTLALSGAPTPSNTLTLPAAVNGVAIGDYIGAVDPNSGNPDGDPTNNGNGGGPFWDGWTYINSAVDGGLPGSNFHPLEAEIRPSIVKLVNGVFIDNPVNGIDYSGSGGSQTGVTGDNGTDGGFTVEEGDTVTFKIGDLVLGTSQPITFAGQVVTPAELAGDETDSSNPLAVRIAQILQSLDSDKNTSNGITIVNSVVIRLSDGTVDVGALQTALDSGTNFETVFGGMIDELTAGNANRAENDIVSAAVAESELSLAVAQDTSSPAITPASVGNCPIGTLSNNNASIFGKSFPVCVLNSDITSNVTLTNDHVYLIDGSVSVGDGDVQGGPSGANNAVLTVEPGTQIYGINGALSGLVITRGSRIEAQGTGDLPIIMAAVNATGTGANTLITDDPTDLTGRGQWAGLVLSGSGINNLCGGSLGTPPLFSEATPTGVERYFGCNDNSDNSGTVEYVVIAESGLGFRPNQEVQGLTLEGVGSGTRINYLQVLGSEDDGIEWFGGAANASNIVINGQDDDGLDFDEGAQLTVQKALVIMGSANGDKGIEADSLGPSGDVTFDATPSSQVNFVNLTILGDVGAGGGTRGANFRLGFGGRLIRSGIVDGPGSAAFATGCLDFDDEVDAFTQLRDFVADCTGGTQTGGVANNTNAANFVTNGDNETGNGDAPANERDVTAYTGTLNATTLALSGAPTPSNTLTLPAAVNGVAIGDYIGAVDPNSGNPDGNPNNNGNGGGPFWDGWTYINSAVDGGLPGSNFHPLQAEIQ